MADFNPTAEHALIDVALPELEALRNAHGGNLETQRCLSDFRKGLGNVANAIRATSETYPCRRLLVAKPFSRRSTRAGHEPGRRRIRLH